MKIITINNCKGGVAKSTSAQAIATILNQEGHKALIIDCDPQKNTTDTFFSNKPKYNLFDVFSERCSLEEAIIQTEKGDIIASDRHLDSADIWIKDKPDGIFYLKHQLEILDKKNIYEFVIIDTNMNQNLVLDSTLVAATEVIVPSDDDMASMNGFMQLCGHIAYLEHANNISINIGGVLLVMYTPRTINWRAQQEYFENICKQQLHSKVYKAKIPRGTAVKDAHRNDTNVALVNPKSKVTIAYKELVKEILEEK